MMFKVLLCIVVISVTNAKTGYEIADIASARIESCSGCSLNRLREVKQFIYEDAPKYERVSVKFIHGLQPEVILLDGSDNELDRLPLRELTREQCNDLLKSKGFKITESIEGAGKDNEL